LAGVDCESEVRRGELIDVSLMKMDQEMLKKNKNRKNETNMKRKKDAEPFRVRRPDFSGCSPSYQVGEKLVVRCIPV
jgi:hypothetical protein